MREKILSLFGQVFRGRRHFAHAHFEHDCVIRLQFKPWPLKNGEITLVDLFRAIIYFKSTFPVAISTMTQPTDQISAARPWPSSVDRIKTSGAMKARKIFLKEKYKREK